VNVTPETFEAARLGDRAALARLLEISQPDIRRYARATCRSAVEVDDATQETLWALFKRANTIRSFTAYSGWLLTVVRRECLRLARRAGIVAEIDEEKLEADLGRRPEPELRLDLAAAFEALPEQYREVAIMRDLREMTIDEIAAALELSRQAVKARLHRARLLLREFLAKE
jgi:RNA polymerase sigma factor (sigma-70 family)